MPSTKNIRTSCANLFRSAEAWNVTTTLITAFFLACGVIALTQTCYVPDNDTKSVECASQTTVLFADKWVLVVLIAAITFVIIMMYQILVAAGITCSGLCNNKRHTITLSLLTAVSATVFANFTISTLDKIPTTPISDPDACFVCPHGRDSANVALMYVAIAVAFAGFLATIFLTCCNGSSDSSNDLELKMIPNDDEGDGAKVESLND